ncbi:hypothetical protein SRHO_G00314620 [Serrasalmus rhombeus]
MQLMSTPQGQAAHLAPVVCLIIVADETHHSRVVHELDEERLASKNRCISAASIAGEVEEEGACVVAPCRA